MKLTNAEESKSTNNFPLVTPYKTKKGKLSCSPLSIPRLEILEITLKFPPHYPTLYILLPFLPLAHSL